VERGGVTGDQQSSFLKGGCDAEESYREHALEPKFATLALALANFSPGRNSSLWLLAATLLPCPYETGSAFTIARNLQRVSADEAP